MVLGTDHNPSHQKKQVEMVFFSMRSITLEGTSGIDCRPRYPKKAG